MPSVEWADPSGAPKARLPSDDKAAYPQAIAIAPAIDPFQWHGARFPAVPSATPAQAHCRHRCERTQAESSGVVDPSLSCTSVCICTIKGTCGQAIIRLGKLPALLGDSKSLTVPESMERGDYRTQMDADTRGLRFGASSCSHTLRGLWPTSSPEPREKARRKGRGGEKRRGARFLTGFG